MKTYYVIIGLLGVAATGYVAFNWDTEPWWISFILGYATATPIGVAITMAIKEQHP